MDVKESLYLLLGLSAALLFVAIAWIWPMPTGVRSAIAWLSVALFVVVLILTVSST